MKTAFITGINGMDGSHLADLLLNKKSFLFINAILIFLILECYSFFLKEFMGL